MSAEQLGASLLADVQEETLDQVSEKYLVDQFRSARNHALSTPTKLLTDLRRTADLHQDDNLGLPELDLLIEALQPPLPETIPGEHDQGDEDLHHEDVRIGTTNRVLNLSRSNPITIEITSNASSSGKTSLLYLLSAIAILPEDNNGNESTIIWLDTNANFSASRLYQICLTYLSDSTPAIDAASTQATAREALKHVHVFPIQSSTQLHQTLTLIPSYLFQGDDPSIPKHQSSERSLSLIILDSAQAFTWPDRFSDEITRLEAIGIPASTSTSQSFSPSPSKILGELKNLQAKFECTILYTTNHTLVQQPQNPPSTTLSYPVTSTTNPQTPNRPNIQQQDDTSARPLSQWTSAATLSLNVSRTKIPQFASHMKIEECLRDRDRRSEVVRKGRFKVWVNEVWFEKVVRDREVKEGISRLVNRGAFVLRVDGEGVRVERS